MPGVVANGLGKLSGDWVFVTRVIPGPDRFGSFELWAIAVDGRSPRLAMRFPRTSLNDQGFVPHQVSPDGRSYAFATLRNDSQNGLFLLDFASGGLRRIPTDGSGWHDYQPVWSPDGRSLAFARASPAGFEGVWLIGADGRGLRRLAAPTGRPDYIYDWTPDSRQVAYAQNSGYDFVDVTTGATTSLADAISGSASWRDRSPRYVAVAWDAKNGGVVITGDDPSGARRVILSGPAVGSRPRWSPTRDEFLMLHGDQGLLGRDSATNGPTVQIVSSDGVQLRSVTLADRPGYAEWTPDGDSIVYLRTDLVPTPPLLSISNVSLRVVSRDGGPFRELFVSPSLGSGGLAPNLQVSFTVRRYD